jgi:hypothetical protein
MLKFKHLLTAAAAAVSLAAPVAQAAPQAAFSEGFDVGNPLTGWISTNVSTPVGPTGWYQGEPTVFTAQAGADNAYMAANFNNAGAGGVISNWLITPELLLGTGGGNLSFWTRTEAGSNFADHLRVLFNGTGSSVLADFTSVVADINAAEATGAYPDGWTQFSVHLGQGSGVGRVAFVYTQANADNANYIGLDTVAYASEVGQQVPEPESFALVALALGGLLVTRRRKAVAA